MKMFPCQLAKTDLASVRQEISFQLSRGALGVPHLVERNNQMPNVLFTHFPNTKHKGMDPA